MKWMITLMALVFSLPLHASLYLVELRTQGTARGSVYYRERLELERGLSEVIGEHSYRKGHTVYWMEEHLVLVDIDEDKIDQETWGGAELLTKPMPVKHIKINYSPRDVGSWYLHVPLDKLKILPAKKDQFTPAFNVDELPDYPSFKRDTEKLRGRSQQDGRVILTIKTENRARYLTIRGADAFAVVGLDWRTFEGKCENVFTPGFMGKAF